MTGREYHRHASGDVVQGPAARCIDPINAGAEDVTVVPLRASVTLTDAEHAAIAAAAVSPGVTDYDYLELTAVIERIIADRIMAAR